METQEQILIDPNADVRGIRPEDVQDGKNYRVTTDKNIPVIVMDKRQQRDASKGSFKQFTLNLEDSEREPIQVRFLFERHLAPLAKKWGKDPNSWTGKLVHIKGFRITRNNGTFWDVELKPVLE